ncbi:MAG: mechanosensitive ion channel [Desulfobulbaceae bacterium]|nr:mechanosensitive ion channel [Desulfobulbaceae bacterium]HIJ77980.1 mechanosensitive ion channel [Deltaproteobacteria bacterium]
MDISTQELWTLITTYSLRLLAAALIFVVGKWLAKHLTALFGAALEKHKTEATLVSFLKNIVYYIILVAIVIAALGQLGINTASFLTIVGTAGLAIGLALKDSLSNFSSGVLLILFRPFKVGDFVTAGGMSGTVREISIFNTQLATPDNQRVLVPNSSIMGNVITNVTANPTRRIDLMIGIGYGDDIKQAKEIMGRVIAEDQRLLVDPQPTIVVAELADSSINLAVRPWVATENYWAARCDLLEKIKLELEQAGITIPYPQRDVHLFMEKETLTDIKA